MNAFLNVDVDLDFSKYELRDLLEGRAAILAEADKLGPNGVVAEAASEKRYDALLSRCEKLDAHIAGVQTVERRSQARTRLSQTPVVSVPGTPATAPVRGPETEQRDLLDNVDAGKHKYSFLRAIDLLSRNKPLDGLEGEVSEEIEKRSGKSPTGFYMPWNLPIYGQRQALPSNLESRAFNVSAGAGIIPTIQASTIVDVLRNRMVMAQLGASVLTDMVGVFDVPKKTATTNAYWISEGNAPTTSQPTTSQIAFSPTTVGAFTDVTRRLIKQTSFDAENMTRMDLMDTLRVELDRVGLNGSGASSQPEGILQNDSVEVVSLGTNGAAISFAKLVEMETVVAAGNADLGNLAYVTSAQGRGQMKTIKKDAGSGIFLWENNEVNGYQAVATNQIPANLEKGEGEDLTAVIYGNFADAIYAFWGAIDVNIDTASLSTSGGIRIVLLADAQFKLRRTESFSIIVDMLTA